MNSKNINDKSFRLTKKETMSLLIIMFITGMFILLPWYIRKCIIYEDKFEIQYRPSDVKITLEPTTRTSKERRKLKMHINSTGISKLELFEFDPNNLLEKDALRLGFTKQSYNNLQKYISKGGVVKSAHDLNKIYGLSKDLVNKLSPFIMINKKNEKERYIPLNSRNHIKDSILSMIHLNSSKAYQLCKNLQIDFKLACRIENFGQLLGAYHTLDQLRDVYGMEDSIFERIIPKLIIEGDLVTIDLSKTIEDSLARHPYIGKKKAHLIGKLRNAPPHYVSEQALRNLYSDQPKKLQLLVPYLRWNNN